MRNKKYIELLKQNEIYFDNMFKDIDENIKLDIEQRSAIVADPKYLMIIAGAGSGKTTTLTAKVKYLIEKKHIDPNEILLLSFTNKAVSELKERINIDFGINVKIKTFHSLGYEIVKMVNPELKIITNNEDILEKIIKENITLNIKRKFKDLFLNKKFENVCIMFIKLLKAKDYNIETINNLKEKYKNKLLIVDFLDFIELIFNKYREYLEFKSLLDYDDLILLASQWIDKVIDCLSYQYIIIDEYQDISLVRFNLINKIQQLTNGKLVVVGDDWQSIYSFSGSEISLFHNFIKNKEVEIIKITNTYRNSQQLINIAGKFIMENKFQIKKRLKSKKRIKNPVEIIYYNDISQSHKNIIEKIQRIIKENNLISFAILSRYNYELDKLRKEKWLKNVQYMTVHSSKGLGFDNVILIGMSNDRYGFPSKIETDEFNKLLINSNQLYEERRLFYVALTRTKNKVFILVPKSNPSLFIKEIENYKNVKIIK